MHGAAAIDRFMRVPLSTAIAAAMTVSLAEPGRAAQEFEALRFYEPLARAGDASNGTGVRAREGVAERVGRAIFYYR